MTVSTTFGYSRAEDRIWISCSAWPQRVWLTRRIAQAALQAGVRVIESGPAATGPQADPLPPAERAAAAHDASLNRLRPGEPPVLRTGREATDAPELERAVLCTRFMLLDTGSQAELVFSTRAGERRLRLGRTELHRWLHALQMVMAPTRWHEWAAPPDWLTRSYLPPALKALLVPMPPDEAKPRGATDDGAHAP